MGIPRKILEKAKIEAKKRMQQDKKQKQEVFNFDLCLCARICPECGGHLMMKFVAWWRAHGDEPKYTCEGCHKQFMRSNQI